MKYFYANMVHGDVLISENNGSDIVQPARSIFQKGPHSQPSEWIYLSKEDLSKIEKGICPPHVPLGTVFDTSKFPQVKNDLKTHEEKLARRLVEARISLPRRSSARRRSAIKKLTVSG